MQANTVRNRPSHNNVYQDWTAYFMNKVRLPIVVFSYSYMEGKQKELALSGYRVV